MKTPEERLQFAVRFAEMDLDHLRPGDWLNLREDFEDFLGRHLLDWLLTQEGPAAPLVAIGDAVGTPTEAPYPEQFSADDFRALQEETRRHLTRMLDRREGIPLSSESTRITVSLDLLNFGYVPSLKGRNMLEYSGSTQSTFIAVLQHLLSREPTDRILRCPECTTIFYRVRKQQYCSRRCVNRANVRHWRQTDEGKQRERARGRKRYRARVTRRP